MCYKCGNVNVVRFPYGKDECCEFCGASLHCCKNCKFFAPGEHYDCHETIEEAIYDKEKGNFCDFFNPSDNFNFSANAKMQKEKEAARKAFESLWGE